MFCPKAWLANAGMQQKGMKGILTAATDVVVPLHHSVLEDGGISNLVLGYAHCGMVAAVRWIPKLCTPTLLKALGECRGFKVKIVGHWLGGGTGALCMTWELAESGKHFIATIINGSAYKGSECLYCSATAFGSHLPSISSAKARLANAGITKGTLTVAIDVVVPFHLSVLENGGTSNLVLGYAHCGMVAAVRWIPKLCTPTLLKALGTLAAATDAVVPFHHSVLEDGGINNLVLGYAHCGMVAAARWIPKFCTPTLLKALGECPAFMTWELAGSGKHFITTIINGSDLVPTFLTSSIDDLCSDVLYIQ
ncbi:hypothetical protein Lal_00045836 [Lupinus albus]|nr:hypothetical protein Lal_00045836 [Lupinus albus]